MHSVELDFEASWWKTQSQLIYRQIGEIADI